VLVCLWNFLLGKTQNKHPEDLTPTVPDLPPPSPHAEKFYVLGQMIMANQIFDGLTSRWPVFAKGTLQYVFWFYKELRYHRKTSRRAMLVQKSCQLLHCC